MHNTSLWILALVSLAGLILAGCGGSEPAGPGPTASKSVDKPAASNVPPPPPPPPPESNPTPPTTQPPAPPPDSPPPAFGTEREAAVVGVGKRGRDYGPGLITTPVAAYFRTQDRLMLLQVAQVMNAYKGEHGYFPKTHQEFMDKVIKANGMQLPELPEGHRYIYDPKKAATQSTYDIDDPPLLVEHPKKLAPVAQ